MPNSVKIFLICLTMVIIWGLVWCVVSLWFPINLDDVKMQSLPHKWTHTGLAECNAYKIKLDSYDQMMEFQSMLNARLMAQLDTQLFRVTLSAPCFPSTGSMSIITFASKNPKVDIPRILKDMGCEALPLGKKDTEPVLKWCRNRRNRG